MRWTLPNLEQIVGQRVESIWSDGYGRWWWSVQVEPTSSQDKRAETGLGWRGWWWLQMEAGQAVVRHYSQTTWTICQDFVSHRIWMPVNFVRRNRKVWAPSELSLLILYNALATRSWGSWMRATKSPPLKDAEMQGVQDWAKLQQRHRGTRVSLQKETLKKMNIWAGQGN